MFTDLSKGWIYKSRLHLVIAGFMFTSVICCVYKVKVSHKVQNAWHYRVLSSAAFHSSLDFIK